MKRNRHYPNNFFLELFLGRERERDVMKKDEQRRFTQKYSLIFALGKNSINCCSNQWNAIQLKMENKNWKMFFRFLVYSLFAHLPPLFTVTVSLLIFLSPKLFLTLITLCQNHICSCCWCLTLIFVPILQSTESL